MVVMKIKTSVAISEEVLAAIDEIAARPGNRSRVIERALIEFVERRRREARDARDREIIDRHAEELNREAEDVLTYQVEP